MKSVVTALSVLLFTSIVSAQNPSPAPAGMPHHDSMLMGKNAPDGEVGPMSMCPHGKHLFPGHAMNFRPEPMAPECGGKQPPCFGMENRRPWGPHGMRCCQPCRFLFMPPFAGMLFLGIVLWGLINILLTIIVSLDMTKNGRFNGLWIPVLLIAGIPGSIIYALFRIGDRLPGKGTV